MIAMIAVAAVAAGSIVTAILLVPAAPPTLQEGSEPSTVDVVEQDFSDSRAIELTVTTASEISLNSPTSGRVTSFSCVTGSTVTSGQSFISINGEPVLTLATSVPLWRDIAVGDSGADVNALQQELARLGIPVAVDGMFGVATLAAYHELLSAAGTSNIDDIASLQRILWIPSPSVSIENCTSTIGATLDQGDPLATLPRTLDSARISILPAALLPGDRVIDIGGFAVPANPDGQVTDATGLAIIEGTPDYALATAKDMASPISATLSLKEPARVVALPPSAIYGVDGVEGCVLARGVGIAVRVAGSQLGRTFVVFEGANKPTAVALQPKEEPSCR